MTKEQIDRIAYLNKKKATDLLDKYNMEYNDTFDFITFYIDEQEYIVNTTQNRVYKSATNTGLTLLKFLKQQENVNKIINI